MEIRRNWSYRYLNLFIISVSFEFVTSFYKAKMFKSAKKVKKIDISLKMYFKASAIIVQKWPYQGDFGSYNKAFYKKKCTRFS